MHATGPYVFSTPDQEAEAQALAERIRELADAEILAMARLLVSKPDREIFGDTEFELRDIVLKVGAKAIEEHRRQKKWLPRMQCRLSPPVNKPRNFRGIGPSRL